MMMRYKLMLLVLLAVASSLATSALIAQVRRSRPGSRAPVRVIRSPGEPGVEIISREGPADPAQLEALAHANAVRVPGPTSIMEVASRGFDVRIDGHHVLVSAAAEIYERQGGSHRHVWALRVFAIEGEPGKLSERPFRSRYYHEQAFTLPAGPAARMHPTFAEALELPPGRYRVAVTLHSLQPDFDPTGLNERTEPGGITRYQRIEVPGP
jgi:hypothetical protein